MNNIDQLATEFVLSLDHTTQLDTAFASLSTVVTTMGFDSIIYTLFPLTLTSDFPPIFLSSRDFSGGFLQHYYDAGLAEHDFTIKRAAAGSPHSMHWQHELETAQITTAEAEVVLLAQHDYGITNAITIPAQYTHDVVAGFSIASSATRQWFDQIIAVHDDLLNRLCAHFHRFVHQLFRRPFYQPVIDSLSTNEKYVIDLVANGYRLKQSSDLYGISPSLAGKTLHNLYQKFSVSDKGELGHLIGRHHLIEMLDLSLIHI